MKQGDAAAQTIERLCDLEVEYDLTVRVLAVLVERLQERTGCTEVVISDDAVANQPDLSAWRRESENCIAMKATR